MRTPPQLEILGAQAQELDEIFPYLFIGAVSSSLDISELQTLNISVSATNRTPESYE
jgi:hypothetical protein